MKDVHTLSFEVRPPASASSGTIGGSIDFYVGPVLVSQAPVEMAVVTSSDSAEDSEVLGPVTKVPILYDYRSVTLCNSVFLHTSCR